ncbi:hypothetical protein J6590_039216, partial [Homalodisca vitripennis]
MPGSPKEMRVTGERHWENRTEDRKLISLPEPQHPRQLNTEEHRLEFRGRSY